MDKRALERLQKEYLEINDKYSKQITYLLIKYNPICIVKNGRNYEIKQDENTMKVINEIRKAQEETIKRLFKNYGINLESEEMEG